MRKMGLEPTRPNGHKILSLARLPIPTLPQIVDHLSDSTIDIIAPVIFPVNIFFKFFQKIFPKDYKMRKKGLEPSRA